MPSSNRRDFLKLGVLGLVGARLPLDGTPLADRRRRAPGRSGRVFHLDAVWGDDRRDGLAQDRAWKSLERVNETTFRPGDTLLVKAGTRYAGRLHPKGSGKAGAPIVIDTYGAGPRPLVAAEGRYGEALLLDNQEYWEIGGLELTNDGPTREPFRYGVRVSAWDYGVAHHIHLRRLHVHDVNGSLVKSRGEGQGIVWENGGDETPSRFDDLRIEDCHLERTDRNGICGYSGHSYRPGWFPSTGVVVRNNLLEDIGGDAIKPWGCDGALVEYNTVRGARRRCTDAAAGIWPWSSDDTIIQFNEVSGVKGYFDGQGFDSDYNCRGTVIQYNYSHDNDGGFILICNDGTTTEPQSVGNVDTVVRYNVSQNDRTRLIHFAGPTTNTRIYNNTFFVGPAHDVHLFLWTSWGGWTDDVTLANNLFYVDGTGRNSYARERTDVGDGKYIKMPGFGESPMPTFEHNVLYGTYADVPEAWLTRRDDPLLVRPGGGADGFASLDAYLLRPGSPYRRAGVPVPDNGGRDLWGNPVPGDAPPSIGAHEPRV